MLADKCRDHRLDDDHDGDGICNEADRELAEKEFEDPDTSEDKPEPELDSRRTPTTWQSRSSRIPTCPKRRSKGRSASLTRSHANPDSPRAKRISRESQPMSHDKYEAYCMDTGELVGRVTINDHSRCMSLDMQCLRCGHVVSRRFLERSGVKDPSEYPQGRPMGTLLAWVQDCPGTAERHKMALSDGFDFNCRRIIRCWH